MDKHEANLVFFAFISILIVLGACGHGCTSAISDCIKNTQKPLECKAAFQ